MFVVNDTNTKLSKPKISMLLYNETNNYLCIGLPNVKTVPLVGHQW